MAGGIGTRSEIGLAELAEALSQLGAGPEVAAQIASSLGLGWSPKRSAGPVAPIDTPIARPVETPVIPQQSTPGPSRPKEIQPVRKATSTLELRAVQGASEGSSSLAPPGAGGHLTKPLYQPLFRELQWRALAHAMLATPMATGAIDLRVVTKYLQNGRPIESLPWIMRSTIRRGVVLILDRSQSMQPFWRDEDELVERCKRVVGEPGVRAYKVETDPWSSPQPRLRWLQPEPDSLPARTPVVIVSDFELGKELTPRFAAIAPWLGLLERARSVGAIVMALVPVSQTLWPAALTETIPNAIVWDNDTTTGAVRRSLAGV